MNYDTSLKPRTAPAIAALEAAVSDGGWHHWSKLVALMSAASTISNKSASNRIHDLVQAGYLERRGAYPHRYARLVNSSSLNSDSVHVSSY